MTSAESPATLPQTAETTAPSIVGRAPPIVGRAPTRVGKAPTRVGKAPTRVGRAPTRVGKAPTRVGRAPTRVGKAPTRVGRAPPIVGRAPTRVGKAPSPGASAQPDRPAMVVPVRGLIYAAAAMMVNGSDIKTAGEARYIVGVMTGTSIDGIDAALVRTSGVGLDMVVELVALEAASLGALARPLRGLASGEAMTAGAIAQLALDFGRLHAEVIERLLERSRGLRRTAQTTAPGEDGSPDLIIVHGQTVCHAPPVSWQMVNVWPIARKFACPVVSDLRGADLAAGGEGAPITPLADWVMFRDASGARAIVNLGGFCNVTLVPRASDSLDHLRGFDVCVCNHVLNAAARVGLDADFDMDGAAAQRGAVDPEAAAVVERAVRSGVESGRSLGVWDEPVAAVEAVASALTGDDLCATVCAAVTAVIGSAVNDSGVDQVILAGGGAKNAALVGALEERCSAPVALSSDSGVPVEAREAMAMAVLGALCADGVPITRPGVTGCKSPAPIAGVWTRV